jgi:hypothetical protein
MGQRTIQNPTPREIQKAFADVSISLPEIAGARELSRFDGLKGNHLRLVLQADTIAARQIESAFGATGTVATGFWDATVPSKTDKDWPWHFRLSDTNAAGEVFLAIEGIQPYD